MARFTEHAILSVFQEMLLEMPFDRITVSALSRRCEISPNTFYYHYSDIHDLLGSWLRDRVEEALRTIPDSFTWNERVRQMLTICKKHERLISHISDSNGRSQLEQYVFEMSKVHVLRAVDERLGGRRVSEKNRADMAEFLQLAFLGFFSQFMWNRMQLDIEQCVTWLDHHFCEYVRQAADS